MNNLSAPNILLLDLDSEYPLTELYSVLHDSQLRLVEKSEFGEASTMLQAQENEIRVVVVSQKSELISSRAVEIWREALGIARQFLVPFEVIVILTDGKGHEAQAILDAGALAYFALPYNLNVLAGYIREAVKRVNNKRFISSFQKAVAEITDVKLIGASILEGLASPEFVGWKKATLTLVGQNVSSLLNRDRVASRAILQYRGYAKERINYHLLRPLSDDAVMLRAILTGDPLIYSDLREPLPDGWEVTEETKDIKSWIAIPLIHSAKLVGIVTLDHDEPRYYDRVDTNALRHFAASAASAIENSLQQRNNRTIQQFMRKVSTIHVVSEIIKLLVETVKHDLDCSQCTVFRRFDKDGTAFVKAWEYDPWPVLNRKFEAGEGIAGATLEDGLSRIVNNTLVEANFAKPSVAHTLMFSMLVVAVKVDERIIGVISADKDEHNYFSQYDVDLVELLAHQAATIIERTQTLESTAQTSANINSKQAMIDVLKEIVLQAMKLTDSTSGVLHVLGPDQNGFPTVVGSIGQPPEFDHPKPRRDNESVTMQLMRTREITQFSNEFGNLEHINPYLTEKERIRAVIGAPLIVEDRVVGVLYLNSTGKDRFNAVEVFSLGIFANQAAIAIRNAELLETQVAINGEKNVMLQQLERRSQQLMQLNQAAQTALLAKPDNIKDVLLDVISVTCKAVNALAIVIVPITVGGDPERSAIVSNLQAYNPDIIVRTETEHSISLHVHKSGQYFETLDAQTHAQINPAMKDANVRAALCLPLRSSRGRIGVMWLHFSTPREERFPSDEISIFQLYANQIAFAYDNSRQMTEAKARVAELERKIVDAQKDISDTITKDYDAAREQSSRNYQATLVVSILGALVTLLGAGLIFSGFQPVGTLSVISGIIIEVTSALFFRRSDLANRRMDVYHRELLQIKLMNILLGASTQLGGGNEEIRTKRRILNIVMDKWFRDRALLPDENIDSNRLVNSSETGSSSTD